MDRRHAKRDLVTRERQSGITRRERLCHTKAHESMSANEARDGPNKPRRSLPKRDLAGGLNDASWKGPSRRAMVITIDSESFRMRRRQPSPADKRKDHPGGVTREIATEAPVGTPETFGVSVCARTTQEQGRARNARTDRNHVRRDNALCTRLPDHDTAHP